MSDSIYSYLVDIGPHIAQIVADSAAKRLAAHDPVDVEKAFDSVMGLYNHEPCSYDLSAVGPMYSLVFHGKRIHDAICHLHAAFDVLRPQANSVVLDYGTGTGAAIWGIALLHAKEQTPFRGDRLILDAYDPNTSMLQEAESLWSDLIRSPAFSHLGTVITVRWHSDIKSVQSPILSERFVVAGYVFSEVVTIAKDMPKLRKDVRECGGSKLAIWSSPDKIQEAQKNTDLLSALFGSDWVKQGQSSLSCRSSFWWKAADANACGNALCSLINSWPDSRPKRSMINKVQEPKTLKKFKWICQKPQHPLYCLARK
ncbi:MAG: hypothetical protein HEQ23_05670 [Tepidisphaera sp.]